MIDRIFSAALTFCLLIAGTLAIGSALFGQDARGARASMPVVELPTVTVIGQRTAMAVDAGASKVAANVQDAGDCALTNAVAPAPAAQPAALAHI
jgi:hypothetical protein